MEGHGGDGLEEWTTVLYNLASNLLISRANWNFPLYPRLKQDNINYY